MKLQAQWKALTKGPSCIWKQNSAGYAGHAGHAGHAATLASKVKGNSMQLVILPTRAERAHKLRAEASPTGTLGLP